MRLFLPPLLLLAVACAPRTTRPENPVGSQLDRIAEQYVKLVLAVGEHDDGYVDAYYGPPAWRDEVKAAPASLPSIQQRAEALLRDPDLFQLAVQGGRASPADEPMRARFLHRQLSALVARVEMLQGKKLSFDEESKALYDAVAPRRSQAELEAAIAALEQELPGTGALADRYEAFRKGYEIPKDRLDAVFRRAIEGCRERTAAQVALPPGESFVLEYVTGKPWGGYNWYQGGFHSLIQLNTSLPIYIDRALDVACHEGYPGHHLYNALLEQHLVKGKGWVELTVYPLYSPQSLVAEGTAEYGVKLAFGTPQERLAFEREHLFPLAGLEAAGAERYQRVRELVERAGAAATEAARGRIDEGWDDARTVEFLTRYALFTPERAVQRMRFVDHYRSYVINYGLGEDIVSEYVQRTAGASPEARWKVFLGLLSSPRLPSDLVVAR